MHCTALGVHEPVHRPATQAWLVHGTPAPQEPLGLHVCTLLPCGEHCVEVGAHWPVHAPETQAMLPQSIGEPQLPVASQVCTPLPMHWWAPGVQPSIAPSAPTSPGASFPPSSPVAGASLPLSSPTVESGVVPSCPLSEPSASAPPSSYEAPSSMEESTFGLPVVPLELQAATKKPARRPVQANRTTTRAFILSTSLIDVAVRDRARTQANGERSPRDSRAFHRVMLECPRPRNGRHCETFTPPP